MSYTPPAGNAAHASWLGAAVYSPPAGDAANATWFVDEAGDGDPSDVFVTVVFDDELVFSGTASYDNRLPKVAASTAVFRHQAAAAAAATAQAPWGSTQEREAVSRTAWQSAARASTTPAVRWLSTRQRERTTRTAWQAAALLDQALRVRWEATSWRHNLTATAWQQASQQDQQLTARHQVAHGADVHRLLRHQVARPSVVTVHHRHRTGLPISTTLLVRWQSARPPAPGLTIWVPPGTGEPPPHEIVMDMLFACPPYEQGAPVDLLFGHVCGVNPAEPDAPLFILPARYIVTTRSLSAYRLPDLTPLPIYEASVAADFGSFDWKLSAAGPSSLYDLLETTSGLPAQMLIEMDGLEWVMAVDDPGDRNAFGGRGANITGRSVTSLLGKPRARESARSTPSTFTAQQLAVAALDGTGAGLDWGIEDWLVLGGAWSHYGTPLAAVQAIAEAAGGYLQSHRTLPNLLVRHPYPTLPGGIPGGPWNWGEDFAADVELAPDAVVVSNKRRVNGPDINAVYVSGVNMGGRGWVVRELSAGDKGAGIIVDPLITAIEAARQRGLSILGAGGAKRMWDLDLPILTGPSQPGVIDVGALVQVNYSEPLRGRVRSVRASSAWGGNPTQTITIEQHLGDL